MIFYARQNPTKRGLWEQKDFKAGCQAFRLALLSTDKEFDGKLYDIKDFEIRRDMSEQLVLFYKMYEVVPFNAIYNVYIISLFLYKYDR